MKKKIFTWKNKNIHVKRPHDNRYFKGQNLFFVVEYIHLLKSGRPDSRNFGSLSEGPD